MTTYTENEHRELALLEQISVDPDATQATLASQLGVAVGTINWHLKRLIEKGYVKVRRAERRKLRYIITPEGLALRARLTIDYIQTSMGLYRLVRERSLKAISQVRKSGLNEIRLSGDGEVAEICRLTCLEQNIKISETGDHLPVLKVNELKIHVEFTEEQTK
ncbi:MAG: winged helix-turn-helix transcriptional regulator [Anaerolineaceae bacterium]|nr:winged helix-turn-helix transcriptional regulator [Anaerolineaceae bacterium]